MNVRSFRFYATLAVIVFFPGLLRALPPTGIPAQTQAPPVSVYLPLVSNPASPSGPILLAAGQPHPNGLAVDSENVYWANCGFSLSYSPDGSIMSYSKSQGTTILLLSGLHCPDHLYVEPDALYWLEHTWIDGTGEFSIFRWPWSGGQPVQLASYRAVNGSLSLDDTFVYWMESSGTVMRLPRTGGTPQEVARAGVGF